MIFYNISYFKILEEPNVKIWIKENIFGTLNGL